jgi:hypothetical protein
MPDNLALRSIAGSSAWPSGKLDLHQPDASRSDDLNVIIIIIDSRVVNGGVSADARTTKTH